MLKKLLCITILLSANNLLAADRGFSVEEIEEYIVNNCARLEKEQDIIECSEKYFNDEDRRVFTARQIEDYVMANCTDLQTEDDAAFCAKKFLKEYQGAGFDENDPYYRDKYKKRVEKLKREKNR